MVEQHRGIYRGGSREMVRINAGEGVRGKSCVRESRERWREEFERERWGR